MGKRAPVFAGFCDECGARVYTTTGYRAVIGWVPNRTVGGLNQVRVIESLRKYLCNGCYRLLPRSKDHPRVHPSQLAMFDEEATDVPQGYGSYGPETMVEPDEEYL